MSVAQIQHTTHYLLARLTPSCLPLHHRSDRTPRSLGGDRSAHRRYQDPRSLPNRAPLLPTAQPCQDRTRRAALRRAPAFG